PSRIVYSSNAVPSSSRANRAMAPYSFITMTPLAPDPLARAMAGQCVAEGGPLSAGPCPNRCDGSNYGYNDDAEQNGVFEQGGALLVPAQRCREALHSSKHASLP